MSQSFFLIFTVPILPFFVFILFTFSLSIETLIPFSTSVAQSFTIQTALFPLFSLCEGLGHGEDTSELVAPEKRTDDI